MDDLSFNGVAQAFLAAVVASAGNLIYWCQDFYRYVSGVYEVTSEDDVKTRLGRFLIDQGFGELGKTSFINNTLASIKARAYVSSETKPPSFVGDKRTPGMFTNCRNGLLDIAAWLRGDVKSALRPHAPDFFSFGKLGANFEPEAKCPIWEKFLNSALPDKNIQKVLQKWIGLNLIPETKFCKFVILEGMGADGKTVVITVMKALLGDSNFSSVGLEAFDPARTFPLAAMVGKLANLVEEIGEMDRAAEGLIKQVVSGGAITMERKFRDPFTDSISARLTFATNTLPWFSDKSDGIWRRLILIPFRNQVLDEEKQDKRLVDPNFWRTSGELPGILNWALEGLKELLKADAFHVPKACQQASAEFKRECNPAQTFLEDNCEYVEGSSVTSYDLYAAYSNWAEEHGYNRPMRAGPFAKEVKKCFPKVTLTQHAHLIAGRRTREWYGLKKCV